MKRTRPDSPNSSTDDAKAPEKRARESVLSPPSLSTSKTTNGFFKESGLKPSDDYGKKLLELAEKQQKDKKPIELQDPAKAHAPVNSFKNEKENEMKSMNDKEKKTSETDKETTTTASSKPIFGTFGKNLTSKVAAAENGNGDCNNKKDTEAKTETEETSTDDVKTPSNPWSSALKKNGGFGGGGLGSGFGFKKSSDSADQNPFKKLGDQTASFGTSVFAPSSGKSSSGVLEETSKKTDPENVKTGEEEETNCLNITTARLFKFDKATKLYKERGRGTLRMNDKGSGSDFSSRLVFRTAGTQRVALNTQIWGGMSVEKCTPKSIRISAQDSSEGEGDALSVGVFLIQCGQDQANELFKALDGRIAQIKQKNEK